jgi:hypothetical protein
MPIELRLPNINGMTEKEQLAQIRSYLYQFIPQLQWALNNVTTSPSSAVTPTQNAVVAGGASSVAPETTFNAIKSLIIKSADIVEAYYDEINKRLEGLYVAESIFGAYGKKTSQVIQETSEGITQTFENMEAIATNIDGVLGKMNGVEGSISAVTESIDGVRGDIDSVRGDIDGAIADIDAVKVDIESKKEATDKQISDIETWKSETKAYIQTGRVATAADGTPIYGVEIGQKDTENGDTYERFARFTADRLEFYHKSEYPIAYISGYKLYITNAEILGELKLGNYVFDTSNGLILKWVEGE